jgi:5'-3' exonuclease
MVANGLYFDTATMYYRSFFAVPESVVAPDGTPSGAIRGFIDMATVLIRENPAKEIVFAWDTDWRPWWRVNLIPSYKSHRLEENVVGEVFEVVPDNLGPQISAIAQTLDAIGLARIGQVEHEADDILGALTKNIKQNAIVVTGDRDLYQLVDDKKNIKVISLNKGMKNLETINDTYLKTRWGVVGSQYVEFAVLRGDPSDGLPGVKGIGEKTAAHLIDEFGNLKNILKAAEKRDTRLKPANITNLLAARDYLAAAHQVVSVRKDARLPKSLDKPVKIKRNKELTMIAKDWGIEKQVNRLLSVLNLPMIG